MAKKKTTKKKVSTTKAKIVPHASVSPTATGPAGSLFEGQVGAHCLLALLAGEPRGLPGVMVDRVEFQRAGEGRPLDDVVVHGRDSIGAAVTLEVQVKREITFAPKDEVFKDVVGQIAKAMQRGDFWTMRYELAVATAKTSLKIAGSYQDLLRRARDVESADLFMERLRRPGASSEDMRAFVETFRGHLQAAGASHDDETVWKLLRRMQILVFDFTAPGSADELLARERCVRALHPDEAARAGNLWTTLVQRAIQLAASGGEDTLESLTVFLQEQPFRLAGQRRYAIARAALAAASEAALADIKDAVAGVSLGRQERVEQIRAALGQTRYVELRGDAGVGKSGLLKHFARVVGTEGPALVLSPGRTIPRGWLALRAVLSFEDHAEDLLSDLASTGARFIFIDNLDLFDEDERPTVNDMLRAAAKVHGVSVIVTARRGFGVDEPSWLPADAITQLGGATTVSIDELVPSEIEELRHAAPPLARLLAEAHPARQVARNLYRFSRLAAVVAAAATPRTEVEMMDEWWRSADGPLEGRRERNQVLKAAAAHALASLTPFDAGAYPPAAVDALVASETLRDLGNGLVSFRHDVLAEWAMASLLASDDSALDRLPLGRPANSRHGRALELVARRLLEQGADDAKWRTLLERVSRPGMHGSWRRSVLLALVRSEAAPQLLNIAAETLLANGGRLLRDLIGILRSVEVTPMSQLLEAMGVDQSQLAASIPPHLTAPSGPAWMQLIAWLYAKRDTVPGTVVPDVADLFWDWSTGMFGQDPLTPLLLTVIYGWLLEIETASELRREGPTRFDGGFGGRHFRDVARGLRSYLVLFSHLRPELAAAYLSAVRQRPHNDQVAEQLLKHPGQLPKAAPAEVVQLAAAALIAAPRPRRSRHERPMDDGFTFIDHAFLPPSPAQGPFLELLRNSPQHGLALIRQLVEHAIAVATDGRAPGTNGFTIPFPEGDRFFPWVQSYGWSRGGCRSYAVVSGLMALEAWAHERVEAGEPIETVLADVLGERDSPAAYLLIGVDLLLSHWPKSRGAAVPFLACPELLSFDRDRQFHDSQPRPDLFGLGVLDREPKGTVTLATLKQRASRRIPLERLLPGYIEADAAKEREGLTEGLLRAKERLGAYEETSTFADPEFMVAHALNVVNPGNYVEEQVPLASGSSMGAFCYVQPEQERLHIEQLQRAQGERTSDFAMQLAILNAMEDRTKSSGELAEAAVKWAQAQAPSEPNEGQEEGASEMREQAVLTSALLAMRDGAPQLRQGQRQWTETQFAATLIGDDDAVHRLRSGLRYNPVAIAFVGRVYALSAPPTRDEVTLLLQMTARPAAAHGFAAVASRLNEIDARLPRAVLRRALASCVRQHRQWDLSEEQQAARKQAHEDARMRAVAAEIEWLFNGASEPAWPDLPRDVPVRRRHSLRFSEIDEAAEEEPSDTFFDDQCGALWLQAIRGLSTTEAGWVAPMLDGLASWTWRANGAGLGPDEEPSERSHEWNDAYFNLTAQLLPTRSREGIDASLLTPICELPDDQFLGVATTFLRAVDDAYFNERPIDTALAVHIRTTLAHRLVKTRGWRRMAGDASTSIEVRLGPAVATIFFNMPGGFDPPKAYLLAPGIRRLPPFLPVLEELATDGASYHVASLMLNLFEVAPAAEQLPGLIRAACAWYAAFPYETELWVDHGIGQRFCNLIDATRADAGVLLDAGQPLRRNLDNLLAGLVSLGVAAAARLERALATT